MLAGEWIFPAPAADGLPLEESVENGLPVGWVMVVPVPVVDVVEYPSVAVFTHGTGSP